MQDTCGYSVNIISVLFQAFIFNHKQSNHACYISIGIRQMLKYMGVVNNYLQLILKDDTHKFSIFGLYFKHYLTSTSTIKDLVLR